jgi:hypothetical protein
MFRSSPDPRAGRNVLRERLDAPILKFQSSPDPKAGRNEDGRPPGAEGVHVPILARPEGRAQLKVWVYGDFVITVPILARPEGRAQRDVADRDVNAALFQSSPDPKAGRNGYWTTTTTSAACSNPRPTRRPGATREEAPEPAPVLVPILARPEGRAQLPRRWHMYRVPLVPILARPEGRAQRKSFDLTRARNIVFQSSPDPKAGRNEELLVLAVRVYTVPILARPEGRAQPPHRVELRGALLVPILARPEGRAQLRHCNPA